MKLALILEILILLIMSGCVKDHKSTFDKIPPDIRLIGENPMIVELNSMFTDPGIIATDNWDGPRTIEARTEISHNIPINGPANGSGITMSIGTFKIKYVVTDKSNNRSTSERTVKVFNKSANYAGPYLFDKTGGDLLFPNFVNHITSIECDSFINNRIIFTRISDNPQFRVFADIIGDSAIIIHEECFVDYDSLLSKERLFRIRGINTLCEILDTLQNEMTITYQTDAYYESSEFDYDFAYGNKFWKAVLYTTNTELYRFLIK